MPVTATHCPLICDALMSHCTRYNRAGQSVIIVGHDYDYISCKQVVSAGDQLFYYDDDDSDDDDDDRSAGRA